jgi:hypothetical protein
MRVSHPCRQKMIAAQINPNHWSLLKPARSFL